MKTFTILGAGWLGLPLACELKKNYNVKVSIKDEKNRQKFQELGLDVFLLNEQNLSFLDKLLQTDYLFINFPPSKFEDYSSFLEKIYSHNKIKDIKKIIFVSSTSIYASEDGIYKEDSKLSNEKSPKVYESELLIKDKTDVIFRCSGLMGYNRVAGKRSSSKIVNDKDIKINYIHRDDVISATYFVINNNINGIFNLCSKEHPTKEEIYLHNAQKHGFKESIFKNEKGIKNRIIDGSKISSLGFEYKYPNPFEY
ncbi:MULTISPECIES: Rossmann-fold NAD(P)-binding domain-containing protein [Arcobacteraceae]|uniref:GDP-L-fucose synthase n=1 Tax=Poseidonibacter parvus TaxID=1850254 RepID=A0A1P8KNI6_9BACT|nr:MULTISPECIES: GDP-L-fucose synthase [Arcobacteraceae]APW66101.1 GDP-L-fucose synthase [Poseidonibacter parvus]